MLLPKEIALIECTVAFSTKNLSFLVNHYLESIIINKTMCVRQK